MLTNEIYGGLGNQIFQIFNLYMVDYMFIEKYNSYLQNKDYHSNYT